MAIIVYLILNMVKSQPAKKCKKYQKCEKCDSQCENSRNPPDPDHADRPHASIAAKWPSDSTDRRPQNEELRLEIKPDLYDLCEKTNQ